MDRFIVMSTIIYQSATANLKSNMDRFIDPLEHLEFLKILI